MLRNYIVIVVRLLLRNKVYSIINILGLSVGIACCILIALYIHDEFRYEKGFIDHKRIFRINTTVVSDGVTEKFPRTTPPMAFGLAEALPEIEVATRIMSPPGVEQNIIRYGDNIFFEKDVLLVDSTFLRVFDYRLLRGDAAKALNAPSTVLISEKTSARIFGNTDPMGQTIIINSGHIADTLQITGVVATPFFPSHLDAEIYIGMNCNGGAWVLAQTSWDYNNMVETYLKLKDPETSANLESKFPELIEFHSGEALRREGRKKTLSLQPLDEMRLYSSDMKMNMDEHEGSITSIYIIGLIGLLILLLACINFMNLTTARSSQRSGETGIRKTMGADRISLVLQFLGESLVIVSISMVIAFLIVALTLPYFGILMQKELSLNASNLPFLIAATAVICLLTAIIAGSYPAFFLSALKPAEVLKGKMLAGDGSQWFRKSLVVFQFAITISLISSILIILRQLNFIRSKHLGFDTEEVVMIPFRTQPAAAEYPGLKESFKKMPGVNEVSGASSLPSTPLLSDWIVYKQGSSSDQVIRHHVVNIDRDYFNTLKINLIAGRDFIPEQDNLQGDTLNTPKIIVNESSLRALNILPGDAPGMSVFFEPGGERYEFKIIGVVKDFHQFSLHQEIQPMIFLLPVSRTGFNYLAASIDITAYRNLYNRMKVIWDERIPDIPFEMVPLGENVKKLYSDEARTSMMLKISTSIALIISCLGLYALSVYVAERRTKEIGIRKVFGAPVKVITGKLSGEYILLILVSLIISVPIGYFAMSKWLEGFAYKIDPGFAVFLISGIVSILIAWLTISYESIRAANRNPAETLRSS